MKVRTYVAVAGVIALVAAFPATSIASSDDESDPRGTRHIETSLKGFTPAGAAAARLSRYYVVMDAPSVAQRVDRGRLPAGAEPQAHAAALASQTAAIAQARSLGGKIVFRYGTLVN